MAQALRHLEAITPIKASEGQMRLADLNLSTELFNLFKDRSYGPVPGTEIGNALSSWLDTHAMSLCLSTEEKKGKQKITNEKYFISFDISRLKESIGAVPEITPEIASEIFLAVEGAVRKNEERNGISDSKSRQKLFDRLVPKENDWNPFKQGTDIRSI